MAPYCRNFTAGEGEGAFYALGTSLSGLSFSGAGAGGVVFLLNTLL